MSYLCADKQWPQGRGHLLHSDTCGLHALDCGSRLPSQQKQVWQLQ